MFVRLEPVPHDALAPRAVRVHAPPGSVTARWEGDAGEAVGRHHVEWTVDEDIRWEHNARPASLTEPGLRQEDDRIVLRGRLHLTEDGAAVLEMGDAQILFDLEVPPPRSIDGTWVEIDVPADAVSLWPTRI